LDLFVFGLYLLLFTIAMGLDAIWAGNLLADFVKDFANIAFFFGAISLAALGVMIFLFLKEQANLGPTPTNAIYNSATYEGYLLLLVILMLATFIAIDWARGKTKGTL